MRGLYLFNSLMLAAALLLTLLGSALPAAADGPSASASLRYLTINDTLDSSRTTTDSLTQNYYISLAKSLNPVLSYQLYLRANINDSTTVAPAGTETTSHRLNLEPTFDFFLKNPMYNINVGYRRTDNRSSLSLTGNSNEITDYAYARMNLTLEKFPLFTFLADRRRLTGHQLTRILDTTATSFSGTSSYSTHYRDLLFSYNASYFHNEEETPLSIVSKNVGDRFAGTYNLGYNRSLFNNRVSINAMYQGNYTWNKTVQMSAQTGTIITPPFIPLFGGHAVGTPIQPNVAVLAPQAALTDGNLTGPVGSTDLFTQQYHNIGLSVPSVSVVDRLYVYVNANLAAGETNLGCGAGCASNWQVSRTTNNVPLTTWTPVPLQSANLVAQDALNDIYYYELVFTVPQSDMYFKAINMALAAPIDPAVVNVPVTEIEARGSQAVTSGQDVSQETIIFSQGFSIGAVVRPLPKVTLNLQYSINRSDLNPESIPGSVSGLFQNILTKEVGENGTLFVSSISRNYSASVTWLTHRLLTTTARVNRSESFDSAGVADFAVNTYGLTLNAKPLPALDSTLTLSRSQSHIFGLLQTTNDSGVVSIGTKLYTDVTLTTDFGLSRSLAEATGATTTSEFVTGSIFAIITPKVTANMRYGFNWSDNNGLKSDSQEGTMTVTYRPGRFLSLSGSLGASFNLGLMKLAQGINVDWIPLKALRGGLNYRHSTDDATALQEDMLNGYMFWKVTKFMDAQLNYTLLDKQDAEKKQTTYSVGLNLNCRFW